jgi:NAD(P)-dependent dehydrogenase (short-subunit alcohol dehydrogenase family)
VHDGVDVLVNNAGIFAAGNADDGDPDAWDRMMAINALAPMRLIRRLAPGMIARKHGVIVNVGSVAAIEPMRATGAYAASKHALRGFSLSTYDRLRDHGIKTVLVNPAFVHTSMIAGVPGIKTERLLTPEDVAAAAMLAIDTSAMCCPSEITLRLTLRADA